LGRFISRARAGGREDDRGKGAEEKWRKNENRGQTTFFLGMFELGEKRGLSPVFVPKFGLAARSSAEFRPIMDRKPFTQVDP